MATNGLRDERMQAFHCWWRRSERRFWIVSLFLRWFILFLLVSSTCVAFCLLPLLWYCFTARHGASRHADAVVC